MTAHRRHLLAGVLGVLVTFLAWWAVTAAGLVNERILLGPADLFERATRLNWGQMANHGAVSLYRVLMGFVAGGGLGILVGIITGWNRHARRLLIGPLELLRPIPPLAWIPIALIWFGTGDMSKIFVIALGSFFVLMTNADKGVRHLDPALIRQARSYSLTGLSLVRRVVLPGIRPELVVGSSVALSISFASLVAAEMLGADSGLGYLLMQGRVDGDFGLVLLAIIAIAALAYVTDIVVRRLVMRHTEAYEG